MGKRRFIAAGVGVVCAVVAACVGDDPQASGPTPAIDGGDTPDTSVADTSTSTPPVDAGTDAAGDPKNCGAPGHDCLGGDCIDAVCQPVVIAELQNRPLSVVVDATHVYWINQGSLTVATNPVCDAAKSDGSVVRTKLDGSELVRIADGLPCPSAIALGPDNHVYFSTYGASTGSSSSIWKVAKDVTATTPATEIYSGLPNVNSILFDGPTLYWADEGPVSAPGRVVRGSSDGGAPVVFAQGQAKLPRYLRAENDSLYWTTGYNGSLGLGILRGAPKTAVADGGIDAGVTALAGPFRYLQGMATTSSHAYYAYGGDGEPEVIESYAFGSGVKTKIYEAKAAFIARGLAVDATHVYAASRYNSLLRVNLATQIGERFVAIPDFCTAVAVDATSLYVTSTEAGRVRRIRKPAK
jgi:hypothetical protein